MSRWALQDLGWTLNLTTERRGEETEQQREEDVIMEAEIGGM
jgi:hypothetical protein